jgi:hypothetical protein
VGNATGQKAWRLRLSRLRGGRKQTAEPTASGRRQADAQASAAAEAPAGMSKARLVITAITVEKCPVSEVARSYGVARSWPCTLLACVVVLLLVSANRPGARFPLADYLVLSMPGSVM